MATKRILIADDSLTIQKAFAMTFAGEDVTLLAARSADEGLTLARQARPDLVIADGVMPGRSGYDLCAAIKSDPALRGVPVYILASSQNPYDEARGRQSGADGQLIKPFETVAFVEKVNEVIAMGASVSQAAPVVTPPPVVRAPLASVPAGAALFARPGAASAAGGSAYVPPSVDDDYGEISMEDSGPQRQASAALPRASSASSEITPPPTVPLSSPRPAAAPASTASATGGSSSSPGGLRPSLIPGLRPGAVPAPARPGGAMTSRPAPGFASHPGGVNPMPSAHGPASQMPIPTPNQLPALRAPFSPAHQSGVGVGPARTLVGLPATVTQPPPRFGAPTAPARPPTQPVRPLEGRTPPPVLQAPLFPAAPAASAPPRAAAAASIIDQKMAAIAARGPEYEAIAKLSREIIEKVVWEVVPELAEVIIREELQKRGRI